jgi:hypothetical protein
MSGRYLLTPPCHAGPGDRPRPRARVMHMVCSTNFDQQSHTVWADTLALHVAYVAYIMYQTMPYRVVNLPEKAVLFTHFQLDWQAIQLAVNQGHIARDACFVSIHGPMPSRPRSLDVKSTGQLLTRCVKIQSDCRQSNGHTARHCQASLSCCGGRPVLARQHKSF